jgi:hypothetical protein
MAWAPTMEATRFSRSVNVHVIGRPSWSWSSTMGWLG